MSAASQLSKTPPQSLAELHEIISRPTPGVLSTIENTPGSFAVLGAGGKMGFHLCLMLRRTLDQLGRRDRLLAVSRFDSTQTRVEFAAAGCEVLPTDLTDEAQVAALPRVDHIFYLAGIKFGSSQQPESLQRMNVDMPRLVARRFHDSNVVALSTGCVYSFTTPESGGATEAAPTDPPGDYARSCLGREQAFTDAAAERGTRSSIIRLNYSVDLRYGVLVDVAQKVASGTPIDLTTGYVNVIWQGDAIAHIVRSLGHAAAPPTILNVTGAETLRIRDVAEAFGRRFGVTPTFAGREAETAWLSNAAYSHQVFGPPSMPVDVMLDWITDWLRRGNPTLNKPTHFESRDGNY